LKPEQHDLNTSSLQAPYIFANPINFINSKQLLNQITSPLGERRFPLLTGARGTEKADIEAITRCLKELSQLALDFPQILELDINPLMVDEPGRGAVAVDCRIAFK
jgi:hypothetical protein